MPTLTQNEMIKFCRGVVKIQTRMRGWCGRRDAWHERTRQAKLAGVMIAVRGTVQGKTGWYCDYDNHCFYFLVEEGVWTHVEEPPVPLPTCMW